MLVSLTLSEERDEWATAKRRFEAKIARGLALKDVTVDVTRVLRLEPELVIVRALRGRIAVPREEFPGDLHFCQEVRVTVDARGRAIRIEP